MMLMNNYFSPKPAALIATNRSGSTFLLHALDSHPQIGCERSEPLNPRGYWAALGGQEAMSRAGLLHFLWHRPGYQVTMFKLSYRHIRWIGTDILKEAGTRLIHLHRENVVRMGISALINTGVVNGELAHPIHTFVQVEPISIRVDVGPFIYNSLAHLKKVAAMKKRLGQLGLPMLSLTYEDLVGYEGAETNEVMAETATAICNHLGVDEMPLVSYTRRLNPQPLCQIVENWAELAAALSQTELSKFLEEDG
jgi:hypothetical protein